MVKRIFVILFLIVLLPACKTKQVTTGEEINKLFSKRIVNKHYRNSFKQESIYAKIKATYIDGKNSNTITLKLRAQKDSIIWMSATMLGIPLAKIKITQTEVQFYEKLGKQYFEGDFALLSDFLGTEVAFDEVQNLLLGQAILDLKKKKYIADIDDDSYMLTPKEQEHLYDIFFWLNPDNFRIDKQVLTTKATNSKNEVTVVYDEYQEIEGEFFPKKMVVTAANFDGVKTLKLDYKSVEFDRKLSFPFDIPDGYKKIQLHE